MKSPQSVKPNETTVESRRDRIESIRKYASYFAQGRSSPLILADYGTTMAHDILFLVRLLDGGGVENAPEAE